MPNWAELDDNAKRFTLARGIPEYVEAATYILGEESPFAKKLNIYLHNYLEPCISIEALEKERNLLLELAEFHPVALTALQAAEKVFDEQLGTPGRFIDIS